MIFGTGGLKIAFLGLICILINFLTPVLVLSNYKTVIFSNHRGEQQGGNGPPLTPLFTPLDMVLVAILSVPGTTVRKL